MHQALMDGEQDQRLVARGREKAGEQVHPVAVRAGLEEDLERVFAPLRREPHRLRHVSGPVGEARELAPSRPSVTTHTVTPNERCSWMSATASSLDDAKSIEKANTKIVMTRNRVTHCKNRITGSKARSPGSPSARSIRIPHSHALARAGRRGDRIGRTFIPAACDFHITRHIVDQTSTLASVIRAPG